MFNSDPSINRVTHPNSITQILSLAHFGLSYHRGKPALNVMNQLYVSI